MGFRPTRPSPSRSTSSKYISKAATTADAWKKTIQKAGDCDRKRVHTGDRVVYHYVGYNEHDMSVFDSSFQRTDPYVFKMGERTVIQGVDLGLHGACVGERLRLSIPPHLGYEDEGVKR